MRGATWPRLSPESAFRRPIWCNSRSSRGWTRSRPISAPSPARCGISANRSPGGCLIYFTSHGVYDPPGILVNDTILAPEKFGTMVANACGSKPSVIVMLGLLFRCFRAVPARPRPHDLYCGPARPHLFRLRQRSQIHLLRPVLPGVTAKVGGFSGAGADDDGLCRGARTARAYRAAVGAAARGRQQRDVHAAVEVTLGAKSTLARRASIAEGRDPGPACSHRSGSSHCCSLKDFAAPTWPMPCLSAASAEHNRHHRFAHRNGADAHTGIVTALGQDVGFCARFVDGLARAENG